MKSSIVLKLISTTAAWNVECPELVCESEENPSDMDESLCFALDTSAGNWAKPIQARECYDSSTSSKSDSAKFCPFNLISGEYAWIDETIQDEEQGALDGVSPFKDKMVDAVCKEVAALSQDLLPGRGCIEGFNCKSSFCKEEICVGRQKNENCVDDTDCDAGYFCRMNINWPYMTTCTEVKTEFEFCQNDYECQNHQFCWYPDEANKKAGLRTCMSIYSQDDGTRFGWESDSENSPTLADFEQNGKYCASGLAYPYSKDGARCTSFKEMKFDGEVILEPFPCDPSNQDKQCMLYFDIDDSDAAYTNENGDTYTRGVVKNQCKCALDGVQDENGVSENNGYCSSVIGHPTYAAQAYQAYAIMMEASNCHTRDRFNMRAQKDDNCGIGTSKDQFRFAIDKMFNITYWPYIQNDDKYMCVRRFFSDSYDSLILQNAIYTGVGTIASVIILSMLTV